MNIGEIVACSLLFIGFITEIMIYIGFYRYIKSRDKK